MNVYGNQNFAINNIDYNSVLPGSNANEHLVRIAAPEGINELQWNLPSPSERLELLSSSKNHGMARSSSYIPSTSNVTTGAGFGALGGALTGTAGVLGGAVFGAALGASAAAISDADSIGECMSPNGHSSPAPSSNRSSGSGSSRPNGGTGTGHDHRESYSINQAPFIIDSPGTFTGL